MLTAELDYDLPPELIATEPIQPRDAARLMVVDRRTGHIDHRQVRDLPQLVDAGALGRGDLFVFNQSRVLPASFKARRRATGGLVRGLYLESSTGQDGCQWQVMLESGGKLTEGESIELDEQSKIQLTRCIEGGIWSAQLDSTEDTVNLLNRIGQPPLPPYIRRQRRQRHQPEFQADDNHHYNTVFASDPGSVAAPTAGLHFTRALLEQLTQAGINCAWVTLHVGPGTFAPVRTKRLEDHPIHGEWMTVPAKTIQALAAARRNGRKIVPIGTTTVRALESLPAPPPENGDYSGNTQLFITPLGTGAKQEPSHASDFSFRFTDGLMTNFHLPRSTLLALVAALPGVGLPRLKNWYQQAIEKGYRFYSYGDAMLIL